MTETTNMKSVEVAARDMEEAVDLVEELLGMSSLDMMVKDLTLEQHKREEDCCESKEDDDFLGYCISLRGQALDFLKKHGREEK